MAADVPAPASVSYNISLNFTSIFNLPSRLLAHIRSDRLSPDVSNVLPILNDSAGHIKPDQSARGGSPPHDIQSFPGPWGFFTSGYMIGLFAMAILMHRIQNIVVPPRTSYILDHARINQLRPQRRSHGRLLLSTIYNSILPLDLTRISTRLAFHLPSLYFISKALLLWFLILLQTSGLYPKWGFVWVRLLGEWGQTKEMQEVCWSTFCAVCAAFCVEGFVRGLDGVGGGFGAHVHANTSPFNLVGYAFLLHIYSSTITHTNKAPGLPSRPDKHVVATITIPLLQLTIFHVLSIYKRWSTHRLFPTALASFLSLTHFHLTILSYSIFPSPTPSSQNPSAYPSNANFPSTTLSPYAYNQVRSSIPSANYPLLNYIPNIFETLLILTILLTITLNALTQLLLSGRVDKPLLGLGLSSAGSGWSWTPPYDEDFGVLLLRVGTASLEATGLRGWGNEVVGIVASSPAVREKEYERARVRMGRLGVVGIVHPSVGVGGKGRGRKAGKAMRGWENEIRDVDVIGGAGEGGDGVGWSVHWRWAKELWRFGEGVRGVVWGGWAVVWELVRRGRKWRGMGQMRSRTDEMEDRGEGMGEGVGEEDVDGVYERFLRGEDVSDDDEGGSTRYGSSSSEGEEDGDGDENEGGAEAVGLYADLSLGDEDSGVGRGSGTAPVLLAHMTHEGEAPLTRRGYGSLMGGVEGRGAWDDGGLIAAMRGSKGSGSGSSDDETRRNCVVCTSEVRDIICWPCRCLSMCDGCRENLASRSSAGKHRCPCCRRSVEGYSRIFIP